MAKSEARLHHYIPQAYLRGFGWKGAKYWYTNAAALRFQNWFQPNVRNIGAERDFLRIEVDGHEPDALERAMAGFDDQGAAALRHIDETNRFEGDDKIMVLNLIALFAVRSPQMRENLRLIQEQIMKMMMDQTLATKERWESTVKQMRDAGRELPNGVTYEQLREFQVRGEYDIHMNREWFIRLEVDMFATVLQTLGARRWRLYVSGDRTGPFITSDRPVVLTWNRPDQVPPMFRNSPGFAVGNTEVYFPLNHRMAVVGSFEDDQEGTHQADLRTIAVANTKMIEHAFAQIYTKSKEFVYVGPPLTLYQDSRFMERFSQERARRDALKAAEQGPENA